MIVKLGILLSIAYAVSGANILFFFGLSSYSHRITVWPLAEKLAAKGHNVTFVQPFLPKKPNPKITEFFPVELRNSLGSLFDGAFDFLNIRLSKGLEGVQEFTQELPALGLRICSDFLRHTETQEWLAKSTFDLVIIDGLMNDCGLGLAHKFKAKSIIFGTCHPFIWWHDEFGIVPETSWTPDLQVAYQYPISFFQRMKTTLIPIFVHYMKQYDFYPKLDKIFKETIDENIPPAAQLETDVNLIFTNTHFSEELARSLPPLVVSVGGIHCEDSSQKLTKELEKFINESGENGFIYVSFGSAAKISTAPQEFQNIFTYALGNSSNRFVWKYEGKRPDDMPSNVFIDSWMPQQAILAHPKIKGFLTHGGLLGIQEAVWHGVPLLAMPIFAEQDYNALRVERTERGFMLDPNSLTQDKLEEAFKKISTDPKYKRNMAKVSREFKDRPEKPVDTAVWWTEYVLRHDDTSSMKPLGIEQKWFQRRLLDVWAFIFTILLLLLLFVVWILKFVFMAVFRSKGNSTASSLSASVKSKTQ